MDNQNKVIPFQGSFQFLSNLNFGYDLNQEVFLLFATSGTQLIGYAITPAHAKRIMLAFQKEVEKFESQYGKIDTELPEKGLKSPIQNFGQTGNQDSSKQNPSTKK